MKLKGTIILTTASLLERLSFYGVRTILVLYVLDSSILNIDATHTITYYGYFATAIVIAAVPFSLITDKILGQRRSIYIGATISLLGYCILMLESKYTLLAALSLLIIGTSLVKPSITILIGRLFKKENKNRTLAYMIYFAGINIGAFIGSAGIGYLGEIYGWNYGFIIAAVSTLLYVLILYLSRSKIIEVETNKIEKTAYEFSLDKSIPILSILVLIHVLFSKSQELEIQNFIMQLAFSSDETFFGFEMLSSIIHSLSLTWAMPLTILVFIYWYIKGVTNIITSFLISFSLLILAIASIPIISDFETDSLLELAMIPIGLYALADVIISPLTSSYVTRISDTKYSNTIYSTFFLLTYIIGIGFTYIFQNEYQTYLVLGVLSLTTIGILVFKNQITTLAGGLN